MITIVCKFFNTKYIPIIISIINIIIIIIIIINLIKLNVNHIPNRQRNLPQVNDVTKYRVIFWSY